MGQFADSGSSSIDGLIDWLRDQRQCDPDSPLSELLPNHSLDQQQLVDLACIDLMQRRRMGQMVRVEHYVDDFPLLTSEANLLDLIDAEICIATELGERIEIDQFIHRFPALADQVRELAQLDIGTEADMTSALIDVDGVRVSADQSRVDVDQDSSSSSGNFSIEVLSKDASQTHQVSSLADHPLDLPDWFIGDQCVASGPGRWLIRGRDSVRGIALALKVIQLPSQLSQVQSDRILDACEMAAKVRNPSWVLPSIAAIQQRHLGVIRPWLFARPWQTHAATRNEQTQLRNLAAVAFTVESAHQVGATHGGIHVDNLLIDHEGKVQVIDAAASRTGLARWLNPRDDTADRERIASLDERKQVDVQDVIKLVVSASVEWAQERASRLATDLRQIAIENPGEACGLIGQSLLRQADSTTAADSESPHHLQSRSWRLRLAKWLSKNA